jgi:hypothetical protein
MVRPRGLFHTVLAMLLSCPLASQTKIEAVDGLVKQLPSFRAPDTVAGEYFFGLGGIACTDDGTLFIGDDKEGCIRVFNLDSQKELFKFGRIGSGPGEFRKIGGIKLMSEKRLFALDYTLMRCTVFDQDGSLRKTIPLTSPAADADFISDDSLITCGFMFERGFKPLRIVSVAKQVEVAVFGQIFEPRKGLIKIAERSRMFNKDLYRTSGSRLLLDRANHKVVYSQMNPYILVLYDLKTMTGQIFSKGVEFNDEDQLEVQKTDNSITFSMKPSARVLNPMRIGTFIVVPIFSADHMTNYLDCYTMKGEFVKRFGIPPLSVDARPFASTAKGEEELLVLVVNNQRLNWVERFSISEAFKSLARH